MAQETATSPTDLRTARAALWLALPALALAEFIGQFVIVGRVPSDEDLQQAVAFVRTEHRGRDLLVAAPAWTDPLLREHAKELIGVAEAGRADLEPFERLWSFSTRGHRAAEAPTREPDFARAFGRVRVERWDLGPTRVVENLLEAVRPERARVEIQQQGAWQTCVWQTHGEPSPGGLSQGAFFPPHRFSCPNAPPWIFVGETVIEDLHLQPRRCIWQHPGGDQPVRTTLRDVALGDRIVLYAGLYYEAERALDRGPFEIAIAVDGQEVGRMVHRDGDGWKRIEAATPPGKTRGSVAITVSANPADYRQACWAAYTQRGPAR